MVSTNCHLAWVMILDEATNAFNEGKVIFLENVNLCQ